MSGDILESLEKYGAEIIAFFGKLHPIAGAVITVVVASLIAYFSVKQKKEKLEEQIKDSGESIAEQTSKDQTTVESVQDKLDDFFKGN